MVQREMTMVKKEMLMVKIDMTTSKKDILIGAVLILLFFVTVYFVEFGVAGSHVVAKYNNGFGTFDMKQYNPEIVNEVLANTSARGFTVYRWYYLFDAFFVIEFLLFQCFFSIKFFHWWKNRFTKVIVCIIPVARALCDGIENILLFTTLYDFPNASSFIIQAASIFTQSKLVLNKLWAIEIILGIICVIINAVKKKKG